MNKEDLKKSPEQLLEENEKRTKAGRPDNYDKEKVIIALEEWSKKEDSLYLGDFTLSLDTYPQKLYEWKNKWPDFDDMLNMTKARITSRMRKLMHENKFNYGIFMREITHWDVLMRDSEREEKAYEASLRAQENQIASEEDIRRHKELMALLEKRQKKKE